MAKLNKFQIISLDPMSQGVSKNGTEIVFIAKTLIGEEGICETYAGKKNISFAKVKEILTPSPERITPECIHFTECGGCQLLHTNYENELLIKKNAIIDLFSRMHKIEINDILEQVAAPRRLNYRNRVQLHYNKKNNQIGFLSDDAKSIINVPECKIGNQSITQEIQKIYKSDILKDISVPTGHVEIYDKDGEVKITWNSRYASEGFSQVYDLMNEKLGQEIRKFTSTLNLKDSTVVDLFGGNGNLTKHLESKTLVIDGTPSKYVKLQNQNQEYINLDLYHRFATKEFQKIVSEHKKIDLLIIDPPRSGLKNLDEFCQNYFGEYIIYVSCNAQTLARDIKKISNKYSLKKIIQFDFFPGTKHFETLAILQKN